MTQIRKYIKFELMYIIINQSKQPSKQKIPKSKCNNETTRFTELTLGSDTTSSTTTDLLYKPET